MFIFKKKYKKKNKNVKSIRTLLITFTLTLFVISPSMSAFALSNIYSIATGKQVISKKLTDNTEEDKDTNTCGDNLTFESREESPEIKLKHLLPFEFKSVFFPTTILSKNKYKIFIDVDSTSPFLTQRLLF